MEETTVGDFRSPTPAGPSLHDSQPYGAVHVLLLYWEAGRRTESQKDFYRQLHKLSEFFRVTYGYDIEEWPIESEAPYKKLNQKIVEFLKYEKEDTLLIIYYGGHGGIDRDRNHTWLCYDPSVIEGQPNPCVNWNSLQQLFLNDCLSPVLLLLDCCKAAASVEGTEGSSAVELIAAAGFEALTPLRNEHSFTSNLVLTLEECYAESISAERLCRRLAARLKSYWPSAPGNEKRVTPSHFSFCGNDDARKIKITRLRTSADITALPVPDIIFHLSSSQAPELDSTKPAVEDCSVDNTFSAESLPVGSSVWYSNTTAVSSDSSQSSSMDVTRYPRKRKRWRRVESDASFQTQMEDPPDTYSYPALKPGEIRLLNILPGSDQEPISCYFTVRELKDPTGQYQKYEALSLSHAYRSEGESKIVEILVDSSIQLLHVPQSIYTALCRFRQKTEVTTLWVYYLCIHDVSPDEKTIQVHGVAEIFHNASHVCIWLGEDADDTEMVDTLVSQLFDLSQVDKLIESDSDPKQWRAFAALMSRPWFSRRWIIQELIPARDATLYCGSELEIDWPDFCDVVALFGSKYEEIRNLFLRSPEFNHNPEMLVDIRALRAYNLVETSRNLFRYSLQGDMMAYQADLETLVSYLPAQQSSNPHDTVYSLISISSDADFEDFTMNYRKNPTLIFKEFINFCVQKSKSLDIILRHWAPDPRKPSAVRPYYEPDDFEFPSWIPTVSDYPFGARGMNGYGRINGDSLVGMPRRKFYNASKGTVGKAIFGETELNTLGRPSNIMDGSMTVSGFQLGVISGLASKAANGAILSDWIEMGEWSEGDEVMPDYFWRSLIADRGPDGIPPPAWYHRACLYCLEQSGGEDIIIAELILDKSLPSIALDFLCRVRNVIWNRRFLRTSEVKGQGLFGLAPPKAREGDVLCIFYGCSVPVALRRRKSEDKKERETWEVIGECFVYGMMDGEAMADNDEAKKLRKSTQEFELR